MRRFDLLNDSRSSGATARNRLRPYLGFSLPEWAGILVWAGIAVVHARALRADIARHETIVSSLRAGQGEHKAAKKKAEDLTRELEWLESLGSSIPAESIMSAVSAAMTEHAWLTRLNTSQSLPRSLDGKKTAAPIADPGSIGIRLEGFAADSSQLAILLRALAEQAGFRNVRLLESTGRGSTAPSSVRFVVSAETQGAAAAESGVSR